MKVAICPTCKREVHPWPIVRPGKCSPKDWEYCIRNDGKVVYIESAAERPTEGI